MRDKLPLIDAFVRWRGRSQSTSQKSRPGPSCDLGFSQELGGSHQGAKIYRIYPVLQYDHTCWRVILTLIRRSREEHNTFFLSNDTIILLYYTRGAVRRNGSDNRRGGRWQYKPELATTLGLSSLQSSDERRVC